MSHTVSFEVNNNQTHFYSGTIVAGNVTFDLFEDVSSVEEIVVKIQGKAKLRWTEQHDKHTVTYSNNEKYFKTESKLFENVPNNRLAKGQYKYPFSFMLPSDIPATFHFKSHAHANVAYYLKGSLRRSGLHFNIKGKHEIILIGNTPLSACPTDPMAACVGRDHKYICCWCCKQGPISGEVNINKTGFIPGETLLITASIENLSSTNIVATKLNLRRNVRLKATTKSRTFHDIPITTIYEGCRKRTSLNLTNKQLQLPLDIAPTELPFCRIIKPEYVIELEGTINGCHINLRVPATIFVASHANLPPTNVNSLPQAPQPIGVVPPSADLPPPYPQVPTSTTQPPSSNNDDIPAPDYNTTFTASSLAAPGGGVLGPASAPGAASGAAPGAAPGQYYDWNQSAFTYN